MDQWVIICLDSSNSRFCYQIFQVGEKHLISEFSSQELIVKVLWHNPQHILFATKAKILAYDRAKGQLSELWKGNENTCQLHVKHICQNIEKLSFLLERADWDDVMPSWYYSRWIWHLDTLQLEQLVYLQAECAHGLFIWKGHALQLFDRTHSLLFEQDFAASIKEPVLHVHFIENKLFILCERLLYYFDYEGERNLILLCENTSKIYFFQNMLIIRQIFTSRIYSSFSKSCSKV